MRAEIKPVAGEAQVAGWEMGSGVRGSGSGPTGAAQALLANYATRYWGN